MAWKARLVDTLGPVPLADSNSIVDHPLAERLNPDRQVMKLRQLLGRQSGPKIFIALARNGHDSLAKDRDVRPLAGLAAAFGYRSANTTSPEAASTL
jgi:hypothetical protein